MDNGWHGSADLTENLVPLQDLILLPGNPRHGDVGAISQSLERFGQRSPIKINADNVVLGGNHTLLAAQALGWTQIAVTITDGLEGAEQSAYALADNRLSDLATYDNELLFDMTMHVQDETGDLAGTGYDMEDVEDLRLEVERGGVSDDEYFTPKWIFEALGLEFDLDVAAPPGGVEWIPAARFFTKEDDGLTQNWDGLVWCNPPYSEATPWVERMIDHNQGVMLLPFVDSNWLDRVWSEAGASILLPRDMEFVRPNRTDQRIMFRTGLWAFGDVSEEAIRRVSPDVRVLSDAV